MNLVLLPSTSYFCVYLLKAIASHPLIVNTPVVDPITTTSIPISKYRLRSGLYTGSGLVCSIFPYGAEHASPGSGECTALFRPWNTGKDYTEAIHHIVIEYAINAVNFDGNNVVEDALLTKAPSTRVQKPEDFILQANDPASKITLEMNTSTFILSDYLELTRLALQDIAVNDTLYNVPNEAPSIRNLEVLHLNITPTPWESKKEVYFHTGRLLVRFQSYLANSWQGTFLTNVNEFNVTATPDSDLR